MSRLHILCTCACTCAFAIAAAGCGGGSSSEEATPPAPRAVAAPVAALAAAPAPPVTPPRDAEAPSDLRRELALLRAEVAELRRRVDAGTFPAARPAEPEPPPVAEDDRLRLARAEAGFQHEVPDAHWSRTASQDLRSALAQAGDGLAAAVQQIDCRARTCRIGLAPGAAASLDDLLPVLLGATGGGFTSAESMPRDPGDSTPGLLYLTR